MYGLVSGTENARLYASVEMKLAMTLRRPAPLQKKKLAPSLLGSCSSHKAAIVCDIADFPNPAAPFSQQIG